MVWENRGLTHRPSVTGTHGMVATAHPLASLAGLRILMAGGNAVDAAVAICAALDVVEPYMSGLGGSGVMLIHPASGETTSLLYGGVFPAAASPETLDADSVAVGPKACVAPGAPGGWLAALGEHGTLDAATIFAPAIEYAEQGAALTVVNAQFYARCGDRLSPEARRIFHPAGSPPAASSVIRQPQLAATYRALAQDGTEAFYDGPIGAEMVRSIQEAGGLLTREDLARVEVQRIEPSVSRYRGLELRTTGWPLTSYEVQLTLNILEGFDLHESGPCTAETLHRAIEVIKLSATERVFYAGRPDPPPAGILSSGYADERRAHIDPDRATPFRGERFVPEAPEGAYAPGAPASFAPENTTHFAVVDEAGNAVSVTQTIGQFFASGFVAGDTGILMNDLLYYSDLDPDSPNAIVPGRQFGSGPLSPVMLFDDGKLFLMVGTPGGFGIPQTTAQMVSYVVDHRYSIQAAIEAPRVRATAGLKVMVEDRVPESVRAELARRGHEIELLGSWSPAVGGGQGIMVDPETGAYTGGADPRRDGYAMGW